jgi:hypothetical protein
MFRAAGLLNRNTVAANGGSAICRSSSTTGKTRPPRAGRLNLE